MLRGENVGSFPGGQLIEKSKQVLDHSQPRQKDVGVGGTSAASKRSRSLGGLVQLAGAWNEDSMTRGCSVMEESSSYTIGGR